MVDTRPQNAATPVLVGASLLRQIATAKDSYQPNDLPPIDEKFHTEELICELQKRALQLG